MTAGAAGQGARRHTDGRTRCRVAVLDDYQGVALASADWSSLGPDVAVQTFSEHVADHDRLVELLSVVGNADPRVKKARTALMSALF